MTNAIVMQLDTGKWALVRLSCYGITILTEYNTERAANDALAGEGSR